MKTPNKDLPICLKDSVESFTKRLFYCLFDSEYKADYFSGLQTSFLAMSKRLHFDQAEYTWRQYVNQFDCIRAKLDMDAMAIEQNDPASKSLEEVYLAYPGFHAIAVYRLSHELVKLGVPILPRMMSEYAHGITGTDIHPGAQIGKSFFIDHATGIVIGETTVIKDHVKIYQGVTLGGIQVKKSDAEIKRHPTINDNVTIYANATILGGDVVIGENCIIGANVCVTNSIPANSLVTYKKEYEIKTKQFEKSL